MQRASEERLQRFFSDASHQLRTPLTSKSRLTELLMRWSKRRCRDEQSAVIMISPQLSHSVVEDYRMNDCSFLHRPFAPRINNSVKTAIC